MPTPRGQKLIEQGLLKWELNPPNPCKLKPCLCNYDTAKLIHTHTLLPPNQQRQSTEGIKVDIQLVQNSQSTWVKKWEYRGGLLWTATTASCCSIRCLLQISNTKPSNNICTPILHTTVFFGSLTVWYFWLADGKEIRPLKNPQNRHTALKNRHHAN